MADFSLYYPKLKTYEGGYASAEYASAHGDSGGETYRGIARNYNPSWSGWAIIDAYKQKNGTPSWNFVIPDQTLENLAKDYSKKNYWDKLWLDRVKNQSVAESIADFGFNSGIITSSKAVQKTLGRNTSGSLSLDDIDAVNKANSKKLFDDIQQYRIDYINNSGLSPSTKSLIINRVNKITYSNIGGGMISGKLITIGVIVSFAVAIALLMINRKEIIHSIN